MLIKMAKRMLGIGVVVGMTTLFFSAGASAHVVVKPAEVLTAEFQTFTMSVPNEKDISTTSIKLVIPNGLRHVQPTQKSGWNIVIEKDSATENAVVTAITWSGNEVKADFRDEFTFSAQVPSEVGELQWKAYQTYSDGTVVSWDKESSGDSHESTNTNSGVFSITKIVQNSSKEQLVNDARKVAVDAGNSATVALYVAIAAVITGFVALYFATRKQ